MARFIPVCGVARHVRHVRPANPPHFTLEELQDLIRTGTPDSYIEVVHGFRIGSMKMLCHEGGIPFDLPVNQDASILAQRPIRGDVLIVSDYEWN